MASVAACHWAEAEPHGEASSHIACAATPSRVRRSANAPRLSRSSSPAPQRATKRTAAEALEDVGGFVSRVVSWTRSARARLDPLAHVTCMKRARVDLPPPSLCKRAKLDVWQSTRLPGHPSDELEVDKENQRGDANEAFDKDSCLRHAEFDTWPPTTRPSTPFRDCEEKGAQRCDAAEVARVVASLHSFQKGNSQQPPSVDAVTQCLRFHGASRSLIAALPHALKPVELRRSFDIRSISEVLRFLEDASVASHRV
eukprot:CAMPEP_0194492222 /NCGR_PEP_ID=MMETSP0253-20130528/10857_1 /TAXON_ID=2966 /ORGANISM="Noctiluca scintillans" /LENGTH=255 /DNA_ID=CAMNT_0039333063 /DNA_START=62 /DNA_END=829 /DNA_ORIENTATION=+